MAKTVLAQFVRDIRQTTLRRCRDADLLRQFVADGSDAAFEALVWRHGPMVLAVGRRLLRRSHDAEDVFQAAFLALARKAATVARGDSVRSWLYKVAFRLALEVRTKQARQAHLERSAAAGEPPTPAADPDELRLVLDEELCRLPEKYREVVVLCYLQGRTTEEAARHLGCPRGTVSTRLAWARGRLRRLLERRGFGMSADALAPVLASPVVVPAGLVRVTVEAAAGQPIVDPIGVTSFFRASVQGVIRMATHSRTRWVVLMVVLTFLGAGAALVARRGAEASPPSEPAAGGGPYALIHVRSVNPASVRPGAPTVQIDDREFEAFRKTQMVLLRSRVVGQRTLKQENLARLKIVQAHPNPLAWLEEVVEVEETTSPEIIRVRLRGGPPEEAALLIDGLVDVYLEECQSNADIERRARLVECETACSNQREKARKLKELLRRRSEELGVRPDAGEFARFQELNRQYDAVCLDLVRAKARLRLVKNQKEGDAVDERPAQLRSSENECTILSEVKDVLEERLTSARVEVDRLRAGSLVLDELKHEVAQAEKQLSALGEQLLALQFEMRSPPRVTRLQKAVLN